MADAKCGRPAPFRYRLIGTETWTHRCGSHKPLGYDSAGNSGDTCDFFYPDAPAPGHASELASSKSGSKFGVQGTDKLATNSGDEVAALEAALADPARQDCRGVVLDALYLARRYREERNGATVRANRLAARLEAYLTRATAPPPAAGGMPIVEVEPCPKCGRKVPRNPDGELAGHVPCKHLPSAQTPAPLAALRERLSQREPSYNDDIARDALAEAERLEGLLGLVSAKAKLWMDRASATDNALRAAQEEAGRLRVALAEERKRLLSDEERGKLTGDALQAEGDLAALRERCEDRESLRQMIDYAFAPHVGELTEITLRVATEELADGIVAFLTTGKAGAS